MQQYIKFFAFHQCNYNLELRFSTTKTPLWFIITPSNDIRMFYVECFDTFYAFFLTDRTGKILSQVDLSLDDEAFGTRLENILYNQGIIKYKRAVEPEKRAKPTTTDNKSSIYGNLMNLCTVETTLADDTIDTVKRTEIAASEFNKFFLAFSKLYPILSSRIFYTVTDITRDKSRD